MERETFDLNIHFDCKKSSKEIIKNLSNFNGQPDPLIHHSYDYGI